MTEIPRADTLTTCTANLYNSTPDADVAAMVGTMVGQQASILLLQETQKSVDKILASYGYASFKVGECVVAWLPDSRNGWSHVVGSPQSVELSSSAYFRPGKTRPIRPKMPTVILSDMWGRTLVAGSYHTPSAVQRGERPNSKLPRRLDVLREAAATWGQVSNGALTHAVLLGGDDNVHRETGNPLWASIDSKVTGLRVVEPDAPTKGSRTIDGFRVRRLKTVRTWTSKGLGAEKNPHALVFAELEWRRK